MSTFPRDAPGAPAAGGAWFSPTTQQWQVVTPDAPLPVSSGDGATGPASDPAGWGATWVRSLEPPGAPIPGGLNVQWVAWDGPGKVWLWRDDGSGGAVVLTSDDGGRTLRLAGAATFPAPVQFYSRGALARLGGRFWLPADVTGFFAFLASTSPTGTWDLVTGPAIPSDWNQPYLLDMREQAGTILAAFAPFVQSNRPGHILRSTDGGNTWTDITLPVESRTPFSSGLLTSPSPGIWLHAVRPGRVLRSSDDGLTWTVVLTGLTIAHSLTAVSATRVVVLDAGSEVVYRSDDAGVTWTSFPGPRGMSGNTVLIHVGQGVLVALAIDPSIGAGGVLKTARSLDGGATWSPTTWRELAGGDGMTDADLVAASDGNGGAVALKRIDPFFAGDQPLWCSPRVGPRQTQTLGAQSLPFAQEPDGRLRVLADVPSGPYSARLVANEVVLNGVVRQVQRASADVTGAGTTQLVAPVAGQSVYVLSLVLDLVTQTGARVSLRSTPSGTLLPGAPRVFVDGVRPQPVLAAALPSVLGITALGEGLGIEVDTAGATVHAHITYVQG